MTPTRQSADEREEPKRGAGAGFGLRAHSSRGPDRGGGSSLAGQPHPVHVSFASAVNLDVGDDVDLAGIPVGRVTAVSYDNGRADVTLGIDNGPAWPLRRGATATLRFGTTIGVGTRRVDLTQGPGDAPAIADGGILPIADAVAPVEWDQVFGLFNRPTRAAEQSAAQEGAQVLAGRAGDLNQGLAALPAGTGSASAVLADLSSDRALLAWLVPATDRLTSTLAAHGDQISALVLVAQQTLGTFAARMQNVKAALAELPPALAQTQTTLGRLTTSRSAATDARGLGSRSRETSLARSDPLPVLRTKAVAPAGVHAADTARAATAPIGTLLPTLSSFLGTDAVPVLARLAPMLDCVVPYAPNIGLLAQQLGQLERPPPRQLELRPVPHHHRQLDLA